MESTWTGKLKWIVSLSAREVAQVDPLCAAILKRFRESGCCPDDWPDDWKQEGAPLVRRESTIYRLASACHRKSICVKIIKGGSRGTEDSASLYAALRHYHAGSDWETGHTVPEPYGWVPEHDAVIMEWVDGRPFSELLKRDVFSAKRRHENIRKAAAWLRWFHSQSEVKHGTFVNGRQLQRIVRVFDETRDLHKSAMARDHALRRYLEVASTSSGTLREAGIDRAVLHGDFKPTNLLISSSGVVVGLDFMAEKRGPVSHDICRFLSDLDFYRTLRGRSFALSRGSGANDFDAFLSAYGGRAVEIDPPTFVHLYFLTILSSLVHQRKRFKRGARPAIRRAVVHGIARQLSREISREARPAPAPRWLAPLRILRLPIAVDWGVVLWESDLIWSFL